MSKGSATNVIEAFEQVRPVEETAGKRKQPQQQRQTSRGAPAQKQTRQQTSSGPPKVANQACYPWNDGGCGEPCQTGRKHVCNICNGRHRKTECSAASSSGGAAKGGGKGGGSSNKNRSQKKKGAGRK